MADSILQLISSFYSAPMWPPAPDTIWPAPWPARYQAMLALVKNYGTAAVPSLCAVLDDELRLDPLARVAAANTLRLIGPSAASAVPLLAQNLAFADPSAEILAKLGASTYSGSAAMWVRWSALTALSHLGPAAVDATTALMSTLKGEHEGTLFVADGEFNKRNSRAFEVRGGAAWLLQRLAREAVKRFSDLVPTLCAAIADPALMVRLNVLGALRTLSGQHHAAREALRKALYHPDVRTRVATALACGSLGRDARPLLADLQHCLESLDSDEDAQAELRKVLESVSGRPLARPARPSKPHAPHWAALDRRDFLFVVQPFRTCNNDLPYEKVVAANLTERLGNALTFWADAAWYNVPFPTVAQVRAWRMPIVWYYFTEDVFNPKLQRDWGFPTLTEYNRATVDHILKLGHSCGREMIYWSVGHEHFDNLAMMEYRADGTQLPGNQRPLLKSKVDGYEFYRKWITTSAHKLHWMNYGNSRPAKFFEGHDTGAPSTWEFLQTEHLDTSDVTMMSGGATPVLAHATFDILPKVSMYWWECQMDGASLQIGVAYVRGAARQYEKKWLMDVAPSVPSSAGSVLPSEELHRRSWSYGYLAGADIVLQEASSDHHFTVLNNEPTLTNTGRTAQEVARFCFEHCIERGEPYQPAAVLLEHRHGLEPREGENNNPRNRNPFGSDLRGSWGMPADAGDNSIYQFWRTCFPGHSNIPQGGNGQPERESAVFTSSTFGDCFDVLTDKAGLSALRRYKVITVLGGWQINEGTDVRLRTLRDYVEGGGHLLLSTAHLTSALSQTLAGVSWSVPIGQKVKVGEAVIDVSMEDLVLDPSRPVEVLARTLGPQLKPLITATQLGKGRVYLVALPHYLTGIEIRANTPFLPDATELLKHEILQTWPVEVQTTNGRPPQVFFNRLRHGWLVTVGNHVAMPWHGVLRPIRAPRQGSIQELWTQTNVPCTASVTPAESPVAVPPFSFRTFRILN